MKILQIITLSELGGAQSVVINLANKLCENNEVIVVAGEGDGKMFDLLDKSIRTDRILSLVRRLSPLNELKAIFEMRRLYQKYRPDIIHLHSSKASLLGRLAFPSNKIVYTVHGFDSIRLAYRKFLPLERLLQRRCAAIVGVSKYDEHNLITEGINNNVSYVYNGIYEPESLCVDPFYKMRKYDGIILCIARLTPQKKHTLFIDVAKRLPDCAFVWIGNQKEPDFDYPDNVFFMGNIKGAGAYSEYADLFFLPSNYEGLPMVIIESLSKGTPVVASSVGGITEILDGCNGWAVENSADKMSDTIKHYLGMPEDEKKRMSVYAKQAFRKGFTVNQMTQGYLEIYNRIYNNL